MSTCLIYRFPFTTQHNRDYKHRFFDSLVRTGSVMIVYQLAIVIFMSSTLLLLLRNAALQRQPKKPAVSRIIQFSFLNDL